MLPLVLFKLANALFKSISFPAQQSSLIFFSFQAGILISKQAVLALLHPTDSYPPPSLQCLITLTFLYLVKYRMKDTETCRLGIVSCSNLAPSAHKGNLTSIKRSPDCTVRTNLEIFCGTLQCQQLLSYTLFQTQSFYSFDREPASASS